METKTRTLKYVKVVGVALVRFSATENGYAVKYNNGDVVVVTGKGLVRLVGQDQYVRLSTVAYENAGVWAGVGPVAVLA